MPRSEDSLAVLLRGAYRARLQALGEGDGLEGLPALEPVAAIVKALRRAPAEGRARALEVVAELLEEPALGATVRAYTTRLFRALRARSALADLGLLPSHGLFSELGRRLALRVLPSHRPPHDLAEVLVAVFEPVDATWLREADDVVLGRILRALGPDDDLARRTLAHDALRAIDLVSHRLAAAGEEPALAALDPAALDHDSPFLAQAEHVLEVTTALRRSLDASDEAASGASRDAVGPALVMLAQCHEHIARLEKRSPRTGATLRTTYELARLDDLASRLALLLGTFSDDAAYAASARLALVRALVDAQAEVERIGPLLSRASRLVAAEIASRAGRTGEQYITRTPSAWGKMWLAAAGAGLVVAGMACLKSFVAALGAPPLVEAALFSANYAIGFVLVGALGLTIATKQPAMTAAAIASAIEPRRRGETRRLVETIQALVRSQLAAILGNCLVAFPAAFGLSVAFRVLTRGPIASPEHAEHLVADLDPLSSLAVPHAALTGVWLCLSGIVAGYVASALVARHVPSRIARSRWLLRLSSPARAARIGAHVESHGAAVAGSIVLGILLGSTGTLGRLLGLPIDIRHVSFASANFGLALDALGPAGFDVGRTLAGIVAIGVTNLVVSFGLSLGLALHARGRSLGDLPHLAAALGTALVLEAPAWVLPVGPSARDTAGRSDDGVAPSALRPAAET